MTLKNGEYYIYCITRTAQEHWYNTKLPTIMKTNQIQGKKINNKQNKMKRVDSAHDL